MLKLSLEDAGWNESLVAQISVSGCMGVEFRWRQNDTGVVAVVDDMHRAFKSIGRPAMWLLIGHDLVQPATRLNRRRGIWQGLGITASAIAPQDIAEWSVESADGLRFFGAARVSAQIQNLLSGIWVDHQNSWMLFANEGPQAQDIERWLSRGWGGANLVPHSDLLRAARERDFVVARRINETHQCTACLVVGSPLVLPFV